MSLIKSTSKESGGKSLELKKHIGTVQISNPLSLIQRKAFTILLFNAYHDLEHGEGKVHSIPMGAFCELLGYNSNDRESLDAQIEKLQKTTISWISNPEEFERVTFFSYTGMKEGHYEYRFDPKLEKKLYHPALYAQINILTLSQFESRYAIALYENLARYRPNKMSGFKGGSPKWSLDEFREIMGASNLYPDFRDLKKRVIVPSIDEINKVSDLLIDYETIRKGRKVIGIKFHIEDNPQQSLALIPEPKTVENESKNPLAQQMSELYGVPVLTAGEWLLQYGEDRFKQVLEMVSESVESGSVKRPIGYISKAFSEGWTRGKTATEAREYLKEQKRKKTQEADAKKKAKLKAKEEAEQQAENALADQIRNYLSALTADQKEALYTDFYDDHHGSWFASKFPIIRGSNPAESDNDQIKTWFQDYVKERL